MNSSLINRIMNVSHVLVISLALVLGGCTIKFVADYDSATFEEIVKTGKNVDKFYGGLLETKEGDRPYPKFSEQYVEIETDVRSLVTRNQARPLNQESTRISTIILDLFLKYKAAHQANDNYRTGPATLDRKRFTRLFNAAAAAEKAKLSEDDKDSSKDSKD